MALEELEERLEKEESLSTAEFWEVLGKLRNTLSYPIYLLFVALLFVAIFLIVAGMGLVIVSIFGLIMTSFVASLSLATGIVGTYFSLPLPMQWRGIFPLNYIVGFVTGAVIFFVYIYLTMYLREAEDAEFYKKLLMAVSSSIVIMALGRWVFYFVGSAIQELIERSIMSVLYVFPLILVLIVLREMAYADRPRQSLKGIIKSELRGDRTEEDRQEELERERRRNPLIKPFFVLQEHSWHTAFGIIMIFSAALFSYYWEVFLLPGMPLDYVLIVPWILIIAYLWRGIK